MKLTSIVRVVAAAVAIAFAGVASAGPTLHFGPPYTITGGLLRPFGLAVDAKNGRLLIADTGNERFRWIPIADLAGAYSVSDAGFIANRSDPNALTDPQGIAADPTTGDVYVVNTLTGNVKHFVFNAGSYTIDPNFCNATPHTVSGVDINLPRDIAVGANGTVYLLDSGNKRILTAAGPSATSWSVLTSDATWSNPYGLAVDASNNIFIADTGNHRIVKISGGTTTTFGHWGTGGGEFRYPRDVAVDQYGRIIVADTYNHRLQLLGSDGHHILDIGHAPSVGTLDKVVIDSSDRLFAVDSDNNQVLAFLGAGAPVPFDPYFRDFVGDPGDEPSNAAFLLSSPDILVRHQPDVDLGAAATNGLESIPFQQPVYGQTNFVYVALHNKGTQPAADNFIKLYWYDPSSPSHFPADWKDSGFYSAYSDPAHNTPSNTLAAPLVAANGGVTVVGPLLWLPPTPQSAIAGDGRFRLAARVSNPYDFPPSGDSTTMPRDSNDVTERRVIVSQGPSPTGEQDTLVILVNFPDVAASVDAMALQTRLDQLSNWITETSWGAASVNASVIGPIILPHNESFYATPTQSMLVDMTQDLLNQLDSHALDGSGQGHEIGRLILVTNDLNDTRDWATTGSWPYTFNGGSRYLTVSVQGGNNPMPLLAHGLLHQLGMLDLYAYDNVLFDRPHADGWDNMAKPINGAHPLVWSKELSSWASAHGGKIFFVPRPAPGTMWNNGGNQIPIHFQETGASGDTIAVAFGLTNGVTTFTDETQFYFVEARTKAGGPGATADTVLPQTGVIMYYANSGIPQGQGPVLLRDHVPGGDLTDAAIPVGQTETVPGTGISVTVQSGTGGADFDLSVQYNPPATDYDLYFNVGNPVWESPDIWADNQKNGYQSPSHDTGELPIAGEENRIYGHISNHGPASAYDVEAMFMFSEPYHTVDGHDAFDDYMSKFVDQIDKDTPVDVFVPWTPKTGIDPHTCARVELRHLFNDTDSTNNATQHNFQVDHSVHGSPYTPVEFPFMVRNEEPAARLTYFRADGIPDGWQWSITPSKTLVQPGQTASATLKLQPPPNAPDCTSHNIYVTGWVPRGDTLVRLGGSTVRVDTQRKTKVRLATKLVACDKGDPGRVTTTVLKEEHVALRPGIAATTEPVATSSKKSVRLPILNPPEQAALLEGMTELARPGPTELPQFVAPRPVDAKPATATVAPNKVRCLRIVASGCTDPKQPNQDIVLRYEGPDGKPVYHTVHTDANGCFDDYNIVTEGGDWSVTAEYAGNKCQGPASDGTTVVVPLPVKEHPEPSFDPTQTYCLRRLSGDVDGGLEEGKTELVTTGRTCRTARLTESLELRVNFDWGSETITLPELRHTGDLVSKTGFALGRFHWKSRYGEIVGRANGLTGAGTHLEGVCEHCSEGANTPHHWELSLDGTVIDGALSGVRVRAIIALDLHDAPAGGGAAIVGTLEGVLEQTCDLSERAIRLRVERARRLYELPLTGPCGEDRLPCMGRIAKRGEGKMILDETRHGSCKTCDSSQMRGYRLIAEMKGVPAEGANPALPDGYLIAHHFARVLNADARGEQGAEVVYLARDKSRVRGLMFGLDGIGTHRKPLAEDFEKGDAREHAEGEMIGIAIDGPSKGTIVYARYVLQGVEEKGRRETFRIALVGLTMHDCLEGESHGIETSKRSGSGSTGTNGPAKPPIVTKPRPLFAGAYRQLEELPPATVDYFRSAGNVTPEVERMLRIGDKRFRDADTNHDGYLSKQEFVAMMRIPPNNRTIVERLVAEYLKKYDRNGDGVITPDEAGDKWRTIEALDTNHDKKLTRDELANAQDMQSGRRFDVIDRNHDGRIDFTEFALWWRERPAVSVAH